MLIMYIDIVLLVILMLLSICTCFYCFYRVHRLRQSGQLTILLRPTKVVFSHKNERDSSEELRSVMAYRNPFTSDYCVHKSHLQEPRHGYVNPLREPARSQSTDSGVSDEYEPLHPEPRPQIVEPSLPPAPPPRLTFPPAPPPRSTLRDAPPPLHANCLNKTWNWNYKEYQI